MEACNLDTNCVKVIFGNAKAANANTVLDCADMIIRYYSDHGYKTGCVHCGNTENHVALCGVNGSYQYLCDDCYNDAYAAGTQSAEEVKKRKNNVPVGLVGAVIGSLIGVALWILFGYIEIIAGIAGLVMIVCALKGYELLGGKPRKAEIIVILILVAIMIIVAELITIGVWICKYNDADFFEVMEFMPIFLNDPDIIGVVVRDVLVGYALTAWASFATIRNSLASTGEQNSVQKYE